MITYKLVNSSHSVCQGRCPAKAHRRIKRFWKTRGLWKCDKAVLAFDKGELIGFLRYNKEKVRFCPHKGKILLRAVGTYVLSPYRSKGVAQKLWARAIRKIKPAVVEVVITSRGGAKLVAALKRKHKKIDWQARRNI